MDVAWDMTLCRCVNGSRRPRDHSASIFKDQGVNEEGNFFCPQTCWEQYNKHNNIASHPRRP